MALRFCAICADELTARAPVWTLSNSECYTCR